MHEFGPTFPKISRMTGVMTQERTTSTTSKNKRVGRMIILTLFYYSNQPETKVLDLVRRKMKSVLLHTIFYYKNIL